MLGLYLHGANRAIFIERMHQYVVYLQVDEIEKQQLRALFPRATKSFFDANPHLRSEEPKCIVRPAVVHPAPGKEKSDERIIVSIILRRVRLLDTDNAYGSTKPLVDCLRTCGLIPDDSEKDIDLKVTQEKVAHYHEQRTEVKITYGPRSPETIQEPTA